MTLIGFVAVVVCTLAGFAVWCGVAYLVALTVAGGIRRRDRQVPVDSGVDILAGDN